MTGTARDIIASAFRDEELMMYDSSHANADRILAALEAADLIITTKRYLTESTAALSVQLEHLNIDAALRLWYPTLNDETLDVVKARGAGDLLRAAIIAALPLPPPTASKE